VFSRDELRAKVLPALRQSLPARHRASAPREGLKATYKVLGLLTDQGVDLEAMRGPWTIGVIPSARRRGRRRVYVERGHTQMFVDSERRARKLAGLLNWCEVEEDELTLDSSVSDGPTIMGDRNLSPPAVPEALSKEASRDHRRPGTQNEPR